MNNRFKINKFLVLDRHTNLVWARNAAVSEFPLTWKEALDFVGSLNAEAFNGHSDWRLPGRRELFSLVSHRHINPALPDAHPFENVFPGYYWTATTVARLPDQAWYIHLGGAKVYRGMKYASYMVWPVRGQANSRTIFPDASNPDRFTIHKDTVQDQATGLFWTRRAALTRKPVSWQTALQRIDRMNQQNAMGFSDWRLPHIRELESLVDLNTHSPALPPGHPFEEVTDFYWSATTSQYETRYAWALYLKDGAVGVGFKPNAEFFVWPVRGQMPGPADS